MINQAVAKTDIYGGLVKGKTLHVFLVEISMSLLHEPTVNHICTLIGGFQFSTRDLCYKRG